MKYIYFIVIKHYMVLYNQVIQTHTHATLANVDQMSSGGDPMSSPVASYRWDHGVTRGSRCHSRT